MRISGTILTNEFEVLSNVNVYEVGTQNSTKTDPNGNFNIDVNSLNSDLKFTILGYDYDTVKADYFNKISVLQLYPSSILLDQINVSNNPKVKSDNNYLYLLGILGLTGFIIYLSNKKPKLKKAVL